MRPKVTWRARRWSEAAFVAESEALRRRYGGGVAEALELIAHAIRERRDRPPEADIELTLEAIALRPECADLRRLDGYTEAALVTVAVRRYGVDNVRELQAEALALCARGALQMWRRGAGRTGTDDLALQAVRLVLRALPADTTPAARDDALSQVLCFCGLAHSKKNVERLRRMAG